MSSALNAGRRRAELEALTQVDVLVIGGGVTGVGTALDAATRGLRVALVEAHDLAFGTSRWSSKLVHGGLRYLASGRVGVARESAVERHILMTRTAPHLIRALPQVVPLLPSVKHRALIRAGFIAGDALRATARTPASLLPRARRVDAAATRALTPAVSVNGLDGGLVAHDGQLVDDARLVVTIARTAAENAAIVLTRVKASDVTGTSATLTDTITGESRTVRAKAVVNATGVWAGEVDASIRLRPSRGTHLVFDAATFGHPRGALTVPVPGSIGRFVFALPQQLGRVVLGLTDEDAPGPVPDEPEPTEKEIDFLLATINTALDEPVTRADVRGAFAGLRPLIESGGDTADLSRRHAVLESPQGVITVVGGKLTTYRRMAQDAVDAAIRLRGLTAAPCRTRDVPLIGARGPSTPGLPPSLVARHGGAARAVIDAATVANPLDAIAEGIDVTRAEIEFAATHEGALDVDDVLHRRTRIGLVPADADRARAAVEEILGS
ncbi:MAG TPA: glycerol-3-phosphate dehydrogenase/oxidase [Jatrophihabitantaceae bacterium]|nr:glycerol-3-phosphate dehydrogenase/oxidase [Jatrophihabitantaceae bacterium]